MPRRRRRKRRQREAVVDSGQLLAALDAGQPWALPLRDDEIDFHLYELVYGHDHFGLGFGGNDEERRRVWQHVGERLVEEQARRYPGTRPWAWWHDEAEEDRRLVRGEARPAPCAVPWFGLPSAWAGEARFEPEAEYLARHGLLLPGEDADPEREPEDPVTAFARQVIDNDRVGKLEKAACQRHLDDLESADERGAEVGGFYFDRALADRRIRFSSFLRHYQGRWARQRFEPAPWQQFCQGSIFGWVQGHDRKRRFRIAYREVARKNGKTFDAVGDAFYLLIADGEPGPEVFFAATKRDQAMKPFRDAIAIRRYSSVLARETLDRSGSGKILHPRRDGLLKVLAHDADTEDSHNVHGALIDELHAWKTQDMWDLLRNATGSREQPLINAITTAGFETTNFGGRRHTFFARLLDPERPERDDRQFAYICNLDAKTYEEALEEAKDPAHWRKANPSLGVSLRSADLRALLRSAENDPEGWRDVLVKRMNVWIDQKNAWLDLGRWNDCGRTRDPVKWRLEALERLRGRPCYGGLDLSTWKDLTAFVLWFPEEEIPVALPWFWIPSAKLRERVKRDGVPYDVWTRQGFVTQTEGDVIDYAEVKKQIAGELDARGAVQTPGIVGAFDLQAIAFDPFMSGRAMAQEMNDDYGIPCVECRHGYKTLTEPSRRLDELVTRRGLEHGAHPVLTWNAGNVKVDRNSFGGIMPSKKQAEFDRIDGIAALIMAIWCSRLDVGREKKSVYEERGALVFGGSA